MTGCKLALDSRSEYWMYTDGYPVLVGTKIIVNSSKYARVDSILCVLALVMSIFQNSSNNFNRNRSRKQKSI